MPSIDLIELALTQPMDWRHFEAMVHELLAGDDLPRLRRLGGHGDHGLDAIEEAFYQSESALETAVQITAQHSQTVKVSDTLAKFKRYKITPKTIVFVFKDACSAGTRRAIQEQSSAAGMHADIRDYSYIVQKLSLPDSRVFARYLGGDIAAQVQVLLKKEDPLDTAPNPLKRSVLASVAAYAAKPTSRLVQGKLFQQTILAVVAASSEPVSIEAILDGAKTLLPEMALDIEQIRTALRVLSEGREIEERAGGFVASQETLARVGKILLDVQRAYTELQKWVLDHCRRGGSIDNATEGYIERNVRDAAGLMVRYSALEESPTLDKPIERKIHLLLSRNVKEDVGKRCLSALAGYVESKERRERLAPFVRSYRSLAIRNVDPLGRRWQAAVLQRSSIALDTDAVLKLLVIDLPEHNPIKTALRAFADLGVRIAVSEHVLEETVGHVERAPKTMARFQSKLLQLPLATVDTEVWHAVVRGFAYAVDSGCRASWDGYYSRYYDQYDAAGYIQRLLTNRVPTLVVEDLYSLPERDIGDLGELSGLILEKKEQGRLKAEFRGPEMQRERVEHDLRMLLNMANRSASPPNAARGYLATEDRALFLAEQSASWKKRQRVSLMTRTLPELATFVCGANVDEGDVVRLVFEPVVAAAAELIGEEISVLTSAGADLHDQTLEQIEWHLEKGLRKRIHAFVEADKAEEPGQAGQLALDLIEESQAVGVKLTAAVAEVASNYRKLAQKSAENQEELTALKATLKKVLYEVAGQSGKGRTRANKALKTFGIEGDADHPATD